MEQNKQITLDEDLDIIACTGEVFRTKMGELSVRVHELTLVSKSLLPLPEKFHGLTDREARYRQRYVDLIVNPEVKDTFVKRSQILKEIRAYLDEKGFLEVDTPILTPFEIGASARPFYTHHNTLDMDMVLRIETELYLKRLIQLNGGKFGVMLGVHTLVAEDTANLIYTVHATHDQALLPVLSIPITIRWIWIWCCASRPSCTSSA